MARVGLEITAITRISTTKTRSGQMRRLGSVIKCSQMRVCGGIHWVSLRTLAGNRTSVRAIGTSVLFCQIGARRTLEWLMQVRFRRSEVRKCF
jgi:hypothetical protein